MAARGIRFAFLLLLLAALTGCDDAPQYPVVGTLERDRIALSAELTEPISAIHVTEGQQVSEGDLLIEQDQRRSQSRLAQLEAALERNQRRLDELVRGPRQERIYEARARLDAAYAALETAEEEFQRVARLHEQNLASQSQLDALRNTREQAAGEVEVSRAALAALLNGTTVEELEQARAAVREAEAAVRQQQLTIERLSHHAPRDAQVEALPFELRETPQPGAPLVVLRATDQRPYARVYIPAPLHRQLQTGDRVTVVVDGRGERQGTIRFLASDAAFTPYYALTEHDADRLSFLTEIDLENADELPSGIPVRMAIPQATGKQSNE
ncbi:HlyD family secretion protein [Pseudidiomarina insulisalsae]|nr:biotin/lipoyl-binding protein [Pseudidiomarina insulisalsae]